MSICLDRKRYVMAVVGWHGKVSLVRRRLEDADARRLAYWLLDVAKQKPRPVDTCSHGRIIDGNGYDRGKCYACDGKGCPEEET